MPAQNRVPDSIKEGNVIPESTATTPSPAPESYSNPKVERKHASEHSGKPAREQLPALNGARGLAVLFVLLDHVSDAGLLHPTLNFNHAGRYGVLLFFSLSAFLLTYLFFIQPEENLRSARHWLNYALRRFLRIFPLFFLALICCALLRANFNTTDVLNHLLLADGQRHFWTIGVEVKYYAILPAIVLVYPVLWRYNRWLSLLAGLALAAFLRFALKPVEAAWSMTNDVWLNEFLEVFLLGSIVGWAYAQTVRRSVDLRRFRYALEACAWICLAIALLRIPALYNALLNPGAPVTRLPNTTDFFATLWALFLFATLHGTGWMRRMLSVQPLQKLGLISYSIYLWHPFPLPYMDDLGISTGLRIPLYFGGVLLVSVISYFLFERPFSRVRLT